MSAQATIEKQSTCAAGSCCGEGTFAPAVDIVEAGDHLAIFADMPGIAPKDIDIQFEQGTLTIHGRAQPTAAPGARFLLQEYGVGDFHRTFEIGEMINASRISAEYANGVLTLRLPKVAAAQPRRIDVKTAT